MVDSSHCSVEEQEVVVVMALLSGKVLVPQEMRQEDELNPKTGLCVNWLHDGAS